MDAALNPTTPGCRPSRALPSTTGLGALKEAGLPLSSELAAPPALESSVPGAGGMPMMPSSGAGMPQNHASEPSDASGLLSRDAKAWTGAGARVARSAR